MAFSHALNTVTIDGQHAPSLGLVIKLRLGYTLGGSLTPSPPTAGRSDRLCPPPPSLSWFEYRKHSYYAGTLPESLVPPGPILPSGGERCGENQAAS